MEVGSQSLASRRAWWWLALAAVLGTSVGAHAGADDRAPIGVTASALLAPRAAGWMEVTLRLESGDRPWRGVVEVASRTAKVHVSAALPAHGRRVLSVPLWVEAPSRAARVWVDGRVTGSVSFPPRDDHRVQVLVTDFDPRPWDGDADIPRVQVLRGQVGHLPGSWSAYDDAVDLVILPLGSEGIVGPGQAEALEHWVRWGGAVGAASARAPATVQGLGSGVAIVAKDAGAVVATLERWRAVEPRGADAARALLRAWRRARPLLGHDEPRAMAAALPPRLALGLAGYAGLLSAIGIVLGAVRRARGWGPHLILLLVAGATAAAWTAVHADGGVSVNGQDLGLIQAQGDGVATRASAWVTLDAARSGTVRFEPALGSPLLSEVEGAGRTANPHRAVRWDSERRYWLRSLALGESATLRIEGVLPDLGLRVRREGPSWRVDNRGRYHLRDVMMAGGRGRFQTLTDVPPGESATVTRPGRASATALGTPSVEFWSLLLPNEPPDRAPMLLARLDPPLPTLRFLDPAALRVTTYLGVVLPSSANAGVPARRERE